MNSRSQRYGCWGPAFLARSGPLAALRTSTVVSLAFALWLLLPGRALAQSASVDRMASIGRPAIQSPLLDKPPRWEDFAGMSATGEASRMVKVEEFTQQQPSDGLQSSQRTNAYLGYDQKRIYIVFVCFDNQPRGIRAHMNHRDSLDPQNAPNGDDYVEVTLDTFDDQRHGVIFSANPLGIQTDASWTEDGSTEDTSWDTVWDSQGGLTSQGYVVWMAIPFRSLRFRASEKQVWGITLQRYIARNDERDFWPRVSSRIAGRLNQAGTVSGLESISPVRNLGFNPYFLSRSFRSVDDRNPAQPRFQEKNAEIRPGMDAKAVIGDHLVLDATVNPDFSQLESDQPQNTVNQRFEVFFPEKRPFFLENANFFDSQAAALGLSQLVFTRRIADPEFGIRLSGKQGPWNLGILGADDRSPGESVPALDRLGGRRAYFTIARVTHDLGEQSNFGVIFTDREFAGDFNRVGGADATFHLNKNWSSYFRGVVSSTNTSVEIADPFVVNSTLGPTGGYLYGSDVEASVNGNGRRLNYFLQYHDITPDFRSEAGFVPRTDQRLLYQYFHFYFRPEGKHLIAWGPESNLGENWDHKGTEIQYLVNAALKFVFRRNTTIYLPILTTQGDTLRPQDFTGLNSNRRFTENGVGIDFATAPVPQMAFRVIAYRQGAVNVVVPQGQLPTEGDETTINSTLSIRPASRLQIDNTYILDRVDHNPLHHAVFNNHIIRSKWNLQFTKELSFRFITQYNGLLANPAFSSLKTSKDVNFDFLITYLIHPGTAVYVGYNSDLQNLEPGLCDHTPGTIQCMPGTNGPMRTPYGFINDGRQLFLKISYLFQR
jgi:Domain of unknown function (DUF5916)